MPHWLRNALALVAGVVIGGAVNMALIPPPAGVDVSSAEGLKKAAHLLEPRHFVMPFLAHALGTLLLAAYIPMAWLGIRLARQFAGRPREVRE